MSRVDFLDERKGQKSASQKIIHIFPFRSIALMQVLLSFRRIQANLQV